MPCGKIAVALGGPAERGVGFRQAGGHLRKGLGGLFSDLFLGIVQEGECEDADDLGVAPPIEIAKIVGRVVSLPPPRGGLKPRYRRENRSVFLAAAIASPDSLAMMAVTAE